VAISRAVCPSALSTSWRSILLTMSKLESAMCPPVGRPGGGCGLFRLPMALRYSSVLLSAVQHRLPQHGRLPERPMGADCKSVGFAFEGSNPSPAT
jgi:hypothetical protein